MLADSAFLMQKDLEHVNRRRGGQQPARAPLYTVSDVESVLARIETHGYHENGSCSRACACGTTTRATSWRAR
jgi:hypothetical protein